MSLDNRNGKLEKNRIDSGESVLLLISTIESRERGCLIFMFQLLLLGRIHLVVHW